MEVVRFKKGTFLVTLLLGLSLLITIVGSVEADERDKDCGAQFASVTARNSGPRGRTFLEQEGFAGLPDGRKVFFRYHRAPNSNQTLVLLNGLIYADQNWNSYIEKIKSGGHSIVQVFFSGHPESLRGLPAGADLSFLREALTPQRLGEEIDQVVKQLQLEPGFHLATLSYGSVGIEYARANPKNIEAITLMAPLVVSTDKYQAQAAGYRAMMDASRNVASLMDPLGIFGARKSVDAMEADAYRLTVETMLDAGIRAGRVPEGVDAEHYKKGIVSLAMGARNFDLKDYASAALPRINLLLASKEDRPALADQIRFWNLLPDSNRGTLVFMNGAEHAMVGTHPEATAQIMNELLVNSPKKSSSLQLDVETGTRGIFEAE